MRACEKFGRAAVPAIAAEIEGKTESEVRQYSIVFWQRNKELADWEKVGGQTLNPDPSLPLPPLREGGEGGQTLIH